MEWVRKHRRICGSGSDRVLECWRLGSWLASSTRWMVMAEKISQRQMRANEISRDVARSDARPVVFGLGDDAARCGDIESAGRSVRDARGFGASDAGFAF